MSMHTDDFLFLRDYGTYVNILILRVNPLMRFTRLAYWVQTSLLYILEFDKLFKNLNDCLLNAPGNVTSETQICNWFTLKERMCTSLYKIMSK